MLAWRKARIERPELFSELLIWSQPAATMDGVITRWQQEFEASEFRQAINQIDHFAAGWTEDALHSAWLLQRIQVGVPAGYTYMLQITDVGLGAQAKAALTRWKEQTRDRVREKARQEKAVCSYQVNAVELVQAALSMHAQMVAQNQQEETVLRTARQAGWLHYRPNLETGKLDLASEQEWAKKFPEGSDRVGSDVFRFRNAWVQDGQVVPFTEEEMSDPSIVAGFQTEAQYIMDEVRRVEAGFELDLQPGFWLDDLEKKNLDSVYAHPSARAIQWKAELDSVASQLPKTCAKRKKKDEVKRRVKVLALEGRIKDGRRTAEKALAKLVPSGAKKRCKGSQEEKEKEKERQQREKDEERQQERQDEKEGGKGAKSSTKHESNGWQSSESCQRCSTSLFAQQTCDCF